MSEHESAIQVEGLCKRFGKHEVLRGLNLDVPDGCIFGLLGINGQGKTTLIRTLLGLLRADGGQCRVLGIDPQRDPIQVRRLVGYMAENQTMYGWMRVRQLIEWVASFYPQWDWSFVDRFQKEVALDGDKKVKALSKGQTSRLALLLALAHQPKLVILDDPTLGLDPIARKDFLRDVIGHLQSRGVTVFFSSHLLYEIEPICDRIAILHEGRIIQSGAVDDLRESVKRISFEPKDPNTVSRIPGILDIERHDRRMAVTVEDAAKAIGEVRNLSRNGAEVIDLNLDEIFEAYVIGRREVPDVDVA
jgi:ABC-2 type transport system ATP-binding protein